VFSLSALNEAQVHSPLHFFSFLFWREKNFKKKPLKMSINVCIRVRPLNRRETKGGGKVQWINDDRTITQLHGTTMKATAQSYTFDRVFGADLATADVFHSGVKDIVESAMEGINGTICCYGQTSSGKTFTMIGGDQNVGVIPLSVALVFSRIAECSDREFLLRVSYLEIYNEVIRDLLNPGADEKQNLKIHERRGDVYVDGLTEEVVVTADEVLQLMRTGEQNRHIGTTNMNAHSSRSHTIFRVVIESRAGAQGKAEADGSAVRVSMLTLVDLAGSERAAHTGAQGERLREGAHINKSLMTLGSVINKLVEGAAHIPYRDSKLTRILQPALGGNSRTSVICTVTPASMHTDETNSTLKFAQRAKCVKNRPIVNEVLDDQALLKVYKRRICELRSRLKSMKDTAGDNSSTALRQQLEEEERIRVEQQSKIDRLKRLIICRTNDTVSEAASASSSAASSTAASAIPGSPIAAMAASGRIARNLRRETVCVGQLGFARPLFDDDEEEEEDGADNPMKKWALNDESDDDEGESKKNTNTNVDDSDDTFDSDVLTDSANMDLELFMNNDADSVSALRVRFEQLLRANEALKIELQDVEELACRYKKQKDRQAEQSKRTGRQFAEQLAAAQSAERRHAEQLDEQLADAEQRHAEHLDEHLADTRRQLTSQFEEEEAKLEQQLEDEKEGFVRRFEEAHETLERQLDDERALFAEQGDADKARFDDERAELERTVAELEQALEAKKGAEQMMAMAKERESAVQQRHEGSMRELGAVQAHLDAASAELEQAHAENDALEVRAGDAERALASAEQRIEQLRSDVGERDEELAELRVERDELRAQAETLSASVTSYQLAIEEAHASVPEPKAPLDEFGEVLASLVDAMRTRMSAADNEIASLKREHAVTTTAATNRRDTMGVRTRRQTLSANTSQRRQTLLPSSGGGAAVSSAKDVQDAMRKLRDAERARDQLKRDHDKVSGERDAVKQRHSADVKQMRDEIGELKQSNKQLTRELKEARHRHAMLDKQVADKQRECDKLQKKLQLVEQKHKASVDAASAAAGEQQRVERELKAASRQLAAAERAAGQHRAAAEQNGDAAAELAALRRKHAELSRRHASAEATAASSVEKLDGVEAALAEARASLEASAARVAELDEQLGTAAAERAQLDEALAASEVRAVATEHRLSEAEEHAASLDEARANAASELDEVCVERAELRVQLDTAAVDVTALRRELEQLEGSACDAKAHGAEQSALVTQLTDQLSMLDAELADTASERDELALRAAALNADKAARCGQLTDVTFELEERRAELEQLRASHEQQLVERAALLAKQKERIEQLEAADTGVRGALRDVEQKLKSVEERWRVQLSEAEERASAKKASLVRELDDARRQLQDAEAAAAEQARHAEREKRDAERRWQKEARAQRAQLEGQLDELTECVVATKGIVEQLEADKRQAREQNAAMRREIDELQSAANTLAASFESDQQENRANAANVDELRTRLRAQKMDVLKYKRRAKDLIRKHQSLKRAAQESTKLVEMHQREAERYRLELERLEQSSSKKSSSSTPSTPRRLLRRRTCIAAPDS
jgi:centromeric protein E